LNRDRVSLHGSGDAPDLGDQTYALPPGGSITDHQKGGRRNATTNMHLDRLHVSHSPGFSAITMAADPLKKGTFSGTNSGAATFLRTYGLRGSYR
jgi:hypothetical protein